MTEIIVIAAVAENGVIGNNGKIPWKIKEDFIHFKNKTLGYPCIMGRSTFESLPTASKPLPDRENIVLSSKKDYDTGFDDVKVFDSFENAIKYCKKDKKKKVFICGGSSVYEAGLKVADTFELTIIKQEPEGDVFFPDVDFSRWNLVDEEDHDKYRFQTYKRKK